MWPFSLSYPLLWAFICSQAMGRPIPATVSELVQRADPQAKVEYCGSFSINQVDYYSSSWPARSWSESYWFRSARKSARDADADTSLFPFRGDPPQPVARPLQEAIAELLRRRNLKQNGEVRPGTCNNGRRSVRSDAASILLYIRSLVFDSTQIPHAKSCDFSGRVPRFRLTPKRRHRVRSSSAQPSFRTMVRSFWGMRGSSGQTVQSIARTPGTEVPGPRTSLCPIG